MSQLILKFNKAIKKITISKSQSSQELAKLIGHSFGTKQKIIGVQDPFGKFYDLDYISRNISSLATQTFSLVTTKDLNEDNNMSFASSHIQPYQPEKINSDFIPNQPQHVQPPSKTIEGCIGTIANLQLFQDLFLEDGKITIVVCYQSQQPKFKIPYEYYLYQYGKDSILVYSGLSKVSELFVKSWQESIKIIKGIVSNLNIRNQQKLKYASQSQKQQQDIKQQITKQTMMENLHKMLDQQTISKHQFYKLKALLLEKPQYFLSIYQAIRKNQRKDIHDHQKYRSQTIRSKQQKYRYDMLLNQFKTGSRENYIGRARKNQIPIIVRKYNNVIEKISTSYPLTSQQQQAVNLVSQLELKGLISEKDSGYYKSLIIQQTAEILQLFIGYFRDSFDQIQLSKKLKALKQRGFYQGESSQQLMRLLIKYARRSSFQLLRKLAIENNPHLMKCYERYRSNTDGESFSQGIQRIANYYRAKQQIQDFADTRQKRYS